jgi:hypothetical protein
MGNVHEFWHMEYEVPEFLERELAMYRSDLLGVQEFVSDKGVTERMKGYMNLIYGKEMKIINLGQDFLYIRGSYQ